MKIAIGMIVRDILSAHPLTDFLDNAEKYGYALDRMIVVYSHQADPGAVEELRSRTNLSLIKLQSNERARLIMKEIGVQHSSIHQLLYCPLIDAHGLIPYGFDVHRHGLSDFRRFRCAGERTAQDTGRNRPSRGN